MEVHDPHRVEGGEEHEKKPVIKKVKDKVRKIKDKMSKKHGHDGEHDHDDYGHSEEGEGYEQDDDDVEKETDPEVHGAPIYDSATTRNVTSGRDENIGHGREAWPATEESQLLYPSSKVNERANPGNLASVRDENIGHEKMSLGEVMASTAAEAPGMPKKSVASDETQLLNSSPRGGDEVGESPLISSFEAMAVSDKPKGRQYTTETSPTGSHDQLSHNKAHQDSPGEQKSSTYTDKFASTATAAKDAAVSAALSAYEKVSEAGSAIMGKGTAEAEKSAMKSRQTDQPGQPVSDKVFGDGTSIVGRGTAEAEKYDMKYGQTGQPGQPVPNKGMSIKEYIAGKLRPGDEDRALSEVITDKIHQKEEKEMNTSAGRAREASEKEMSTSAGRAREASGKDGGGKGMVEKIKGAVTSWIGAGASPSEATDTEVKEKQQSANTGMSATKEKGMQ